MLSKQQQKEYRSQLFRHLDGISTVPSAFALYEKGVLKFLLEHKSASLSELAEEFKANDGYLNVALRVLCSQGWLDQTVDNRKDEVFFKTNDISPYAFELVRFYRGANDLFKFWNNLDPNNLNRSAFDQLASQYAQFRNEFNIPKAENKPNNAIRSQVLTHIEGVLTSPAVVMLGMGGMFHKYFMEASFRAEEYHEDPQIFEYILDFLTHLNWFKKSNKTYRFTYKGLFFAKRVSAYGVTVSYLPTFEKIDVLIFGDPLILKTGEGEKELHVNREMNVWGSGGAHSAYFKKVDEILIDLFNRPINEQPKGILDMGCGNGAFLIHIFDVIEQRTYRGKILDQHPLLLVGADYNDSALKVTRANLVKADIWAKVVWGDIGKPHLLAEKLNAEYGIDIGELLNVRTFLDHNRIWEDPPFESKRISTSTGAFASNGRRLSNNAVEDNLLMHFKAWAPFIQKFGLLVIELHTLDPNLTASHIGKTPATAYDATHGYSDQYILEAAVFLKIAKEAGLYADERLKARFPNSELATVTVNLLKRAGVSETLDIE